MNAYISPLVSIIMPTYNRANYIVETIESICNQTYTHWELLVLDDGSDDNTEELIAGIKDSRIRYYKFQRTNIKGRLQVAGIEHANGSLISFMDSDDLWHPEKMERQVQALLQYPEAGFSITGGYNFKELGVACEYFYKKREGSHFGDIFIPFCKGEISCFTQAIIIWKKYVEDKTLFNTSQTSAEIMLIGTLAYRHKCIVLYDNLFYRRLHAVNHSSLSWIDNFNDGIEQMKHFEKNGMLSHSIARRVFFKSYLRFGERAIYYKKWGLALHSFYQAWLNKPFSIIPLKKMGKLLVFYFKGGPQ